MNQIKCLQLVARHPSGVALALLCLGWIFVVINSDSVLAQDLPQQSAPADQEREQSIDNISRLQTQIQEAKSKQDFASAIKLANAKLEIEVKVFGKISEEVALTIESIAAMRLGTGQNNESLRAFEEAYRIRRDLDGEQYFQKCERSYESGGGSKQHCLLRSTASGAWRKVFQARCSNATNPR